MKLDKKTLKDMFPHLFKELESDEHKVSIDSIRTNPESGEKAASKKFSNYQPDVVDFIRRCDTPEQAEDIIHFMKKRGEISKSYAQRLSRQLKEKGVRSFGSKKEDNYYFNKAKSGQN
ncbi:MAG: DUF2095 family protein [Thermoproteota archaeon]